LGFDSCVVTVIIFFGVPWKDLEILVPVFYLLPVFGVFSIKYKKKKTFESKIYVKVVRLKSFFPVIFSGRFRACP
jgi:hypothetical protein